MTETIDLGKYHANEGRHERIKRYRSYLGLDENFEINEENIDSDALAYVSCYSNCTKERVKSELLGKRWSELEED